MLCPGGCGCEAHSGSGVMLKWPLRPAVRVRAPAAPHKHPGKLSAVEALAAQSPAAPHICSPAPLGSLIVPFTSSLLDQFSLSCKTQRSPVPVPILPQPSHQHPHPTTVTIGKQSACVIICEGAENSGNTTAGGRRHRALVFRVALRESVMLSTRSVHAPQILSQPPMELAPGSPREPL